MCVIIIIIAVVCIFKMFLASLTQNKGDRWQIEKERKNKMNKNKTYKKSTTNQ